MTAAENKAINDMKPKLIERVEMVFKNKHKNDIPKRRQYSGLVQAAAQASCVDELVLLIQYKNAKEGSKLKWTKLAEPLVKSINDLKNLAREIDSNLKKKNETDKAIETDDLKKDSRTDKEIETDDPKKDRRTDKEIEADINRYHLQLTKMFLGYLMWKGNVLNP